MLMDQPTQLSQVTPPDIAMDPSRALRHVLVVDDSRAQVMMLSRLLGRWGLNVSVATSAKDALDIAKENPPDLILSDWVMPEMDGLEFCRAFRENSASQFGYFILLSSKSDKGEIAEGLDAGADDFLTKPVHANELRARINAASRIVYMQRELTRKNGMVSDTLAELRKAYDAIDRDLKQARRIQDSLVPERTRRVGNVQISMLLHPCGHVGGDLVGMFDTGAGVGLYGIDVSGHGICSAMVAARVAGSVGGFGKAEFEGIVLPKAESGEDVVHLSHSTGSIPIHAIVTETPASLFNLDQRRDWALEGNAAILGAQDSKDPDWDEGFSPRLGPKSMRRGDKPYAELVPEYTPGQGDTVEATSGHANRLPYTMVVQQVHARLADSPNLRAFLARRPDRVRQLVRPPFARLADLPHRPGPQKPAAVADRNSGKNKTSDAKAGNGDDELRYRDPRSTLDQTYDMRMPPYMRHSMGVPLTITRRQYTLLLAYLDKLETDPEWRKPVMPEPTGDHA